MDQPTKTIRVSAGTRIYYFDALTDKKGQPYLSISEIPTDTNPGNKKRRRIFVHSEDFGKFAKAFNEIANHIKENGKSGEATDE